MLDQLEVADSGVRQKSATQSADVERTARHLSLEDLESYANGRLAPVRLSQCQSHLDACEACRAELEDLRSIGSEVSGFVRAEPSRVGSNRRKRRSGVTLHVIAAVVTISAAAVGGAFWWTHGSPAATSTRAAVANAPSASRAPTQRHIPPTSPATAALPAAAAVAAVATPAPHIQSRNRVAEDLAALPDDVRLAVSTAIQDGKLQVPTDVGAAHGRPGALSEVPATNREFALLGPFGAAIFDTRPEFRWQPLPGATRYSVTIVDTGLHPVQRSPALRKTVWRPRRPLRRGRTYLWQVTATLRGGSKVVASRPSPSETQLRVVPMKLADELARFRRDHQEAHLVLGTLYAQAGMLTDSTNELKQVPPGDPSYNTARALLQSLSPATAHEMPASN